MRLFIAHFILVEESAVSRRHYISSSLFAAATAEDAYNTAQTWVQAHEDSAHNKAGELIRYYSSGLYDLEEASVDLHQLQSAVTGLYGVEVGHLPMVGSNMAPVPKAKDALAVFLAAQPVAAADGFAVR
jgi:Leu/Phe-tRNA-protein transferase